MKKCKFIKVKETSQGSVQELIMFQEITHGGNPIGEPWFEEYTREKYISLVEISKNQGWPAPEWPIRYITIK